MEKIKKIFLIVMGIAFFVHIVFYALYLFGVISFDTYIDLLVKTGLRRTYSYSLEWLRNLIYFILLVLIIKALKKSNI